MSICFFDNNASTPVHPDVLKFHENVLREAWANPASNHFLGRIANEHLEQARREIAQTLNCEAEGVFFTSGGTESNNGFLASVMRSAAAGGRKRRVIVSGIEHKSVLVAARELAGTYGLEVDIIKPVASGHVSVTQLEQALDDRTLLVSVMLANNETGAIQDLKAVADLCHRHKIMVHTDAVGAIGKMPVDFKDLGVDAMSISAHKLYAPKGAGALLIRQNLLDSPWIFGCGQQQGMRSGTENVPGVAAMGHAMRLLRDGTLDTQKHCERLRVQMAGELRARLGDRLRFQTAEPCVANTLSIAIDGCSGPKMQKYLSDRGICVSVGAAAGDGNPSHVLAAMGISRTQAQSTLRISLGWGNTERQVAFFCEQLEQAAAATETGL